MLPNKYRWKLSNKISSPNILEQILNNRGIDDLDAINCFLKPSTAQLLDPYLLNDMEKAVDKIELAKATNKHIVIYGDYDVDGVTSTSILYMFLKEEGYRVSYYIPNRQAEGYGLNKEALEGIKGYGDLVITVDTGIAAIDEVLYARSINLDVIITDHHECQEQLPCADCIINPKRRDTTYPFDSLAGVGVTFKLIHALAIRRNVEHKIWRYMDIVALGTVADVVPLIGENRVITALGFKQMENTEHIGLKQLLSLVQTKDNKITSNTIGYQVGPRINAAGRLSDAKIGVELLITQDEEKAKEIALMLDLENKKRQDMELEIVEQAEAYIQENIDLEQEKIIIVVGKEWHHGVIGIVASRIMNRYYRPTIILTEEDGILSGSARSVDGFNIFEAISEVKDCLIRFGGHEMAAGLSMNVDEISRFKERLNIYAEKMLNQEILTPSLEIDAEISADKLSLLLCEELGRLEPFGMANPTPTFCVQGTLQYAQKIGQDKHLKVSIQKNNVVIQGVGFDKAYLADYLTQGEEVVIACELTKNIWNGKTSLQLRVKDIKSPEEKIMESQYYMALYDYMPNPKPITSCPVPIKKSVTDVRECSSFNVYTENGLKNLYKTLKTNKNKFTLDFKICYNKYCVLNSGTVIYVNPLEKQKAVNYDWDFKDQTEYSCIKPDFTGHKEQLSKMVPSHTDCTVVYKFLKNIGDTSIPVHKCVQAFGMYQMTEYKLQQILDVFTELDLIHYTLENENILFELKRAAKTKLENSRRYVGLQQFAESIRKIY
ncbi:MAG: single-stranded-DNA-specific exonuclease RecJ [Cellulosilyticaceae bacterium]